MNKSKNLNTSESDQNFPRQNSLITNILTFFCGTACRGISLNEMFPSASQDNILDNKLGRLDT